MAYNLNSMQPTLNLCLSSNGKYRGAVYAPSFDLSQSIKVPLDSIGVISLNKVYMSSPPMLDTSLSMTIKINAQEQDARTKAWYDVVHEVRVDAASNVLYDLVSVWVDNVSDTAKKTQAWCLFLKYIIQGLNKTPASVIDLGNVYQM